MCPAAQSGNVSEYKKDRLWAVFFQLGTNRGAYPSKVQKEEKEVFPMKRLKAAMCAVLAGLMLAGCAVQPQTDNKRGGGAAVDLTKYVVREAAYPAYPKEPRFEDYFDENGEGDWDAYDAAYTEYREALQKLGKLDAEPDGGAVLAFADRTLGKIFADSENRVYSPISLYVALSMLTEMTAGETKQQVMELLSAADSETLRQTVRDLWMSVYLDDGRSVCRLANGAFLRENADVKQEAVDALADWYYASTYRVPMGTAEADEAIAGWLNQNTGGLLSEETGEIQTEVDNLLRLYNTIYYKSSWQDAFESSRTREDVFTAANGAKQKTEFMHRTESGSYRKGEGYTAAPRSLNYGRMVFVLPDEGVTPESLLQRQGFLAELAGDYNAAELVWSVPKFDVKSSTGLNEALRSLGVTDAFDGTKADFTPLTDNGAAVDSVMQAARVKIDEDGVEAAAYTEIVANDSAMMETPPTVEMELDRPFLFVIFDYNNVPLFVGTVNTVA